MEWNTGMTFYPWGAMSYSTSKEVKISVGILTTYGRLGEAGQLLQATS